MVLRVKSSDQQSLYTDGQHTFAFYIKCVPLVGTHGDVSWVGSPLRSPSPGGAVFISSATQAKLARSES